MTNLTIFSFHDAQARRNCKIRTTVDKDGGVWFVLGDLLAAMNSSARLGRAKESALRTLGPDDVCSITIAKNGSKEVTVVSMFGAITLAARSRTDSKHRLYKRLYEDYMRSPNWFAAGAMEVA